MPGLMHEYIQSQLGSLIALGGFGRNVTNVIGNTRKTFQTRFLAKQIFSFLKADSSGAGDIRQGKGVQVSHPIVMRKTGLGTHPKTIPQGNTRTNSSDGGTTSQMAGDHPKIRLFHR